MKSLSYFIDTTPKYPIDSFLRHMKFHNKKKLDKKNCQLKLPNKKESWMNWTSEINEFLSSYKKWSRTNERTNEKTVYFSLNYHILLRLLSNLAIKWIYLSPSMPLCRIDPCMRLVSGSFNTVQYLLFQMRWNLVRKWAIVRNVMSLLTHCGFNVLTYVRKFERHLYVYKTMVWRSRHYRTDFSSTVHI